MYNLEYIRFIAATVLMSTLDHRNSYLVAKYSINQDWIYCTCVACRVTVIRDRMLVRSADARTAVQVGYK